ncbi:orotate phosphoribosyltransferase, partial [Salmonella enterica subsp. enterica serovar Poona]
MDFKATEKSPFFLSVNFVNDESKKRSESMKPYQRQFI